MVQNAFSIFFFSVEEKLIMPISDSFFAKLKLPPQTVYWSQYRSKVS